MKTKKLGNTDLDLTVIGLGTWAIGGAGWEFGWGPQQDADSIAAIHRALDLGINWIDTAAVYGLGHSEEIVAKALEGRREKVVVATKCGLTWNEKRKIIRRLDASSVKKECEDSLRRLKTDRIDLYQIHWPDPDRQVEEGWTALAELIQEGKVRYGGVSNFSVGQMERARAIAPIASLQPPFSLIRRDIEKEILPYCRDRQIGVVVYSPMGAGLLTGKYDAEKAAKLPAEDWRKKFNENFRQPRLGLIETFVHRLDQLAKEYGRTVAQLAVAWTLARPGVTCAIVGARNPAQIEQTAPAGDWELGEDLLAEIEQLHRAILGDSKG